MRMDERRLRLEGGAGRRRVDAAGLLGKVATIAAGAILLVAVFMFSLLVFAIVAAGVSLAWGYLWWKTRDLRAQMRERPTGERVIEGEVIREGARNDADQR